MVDELQDTSTRCCFFRSLQRPSAILVALRVLSPSRGRAHSGFFHFGMAQSSAQRYTDES